MTVCVDGFTMGIDRGGMGDISPHYFRWGWSVLSSPQYFTVECHIIPTKIAEVYRPTNKNNERNRF